MQTWIQRALIGCFLFATFVLSGCSSLQQEAVGPPSPGPGAGMARIYFVLNQGQPPAEAYIVERSTLLGYVENSEHIVVDVPAGEHTFMLIAEHDEAVQGNFMEGKTYHMRIFATPGVWGTRVYWTPLKASGEDLQERKDEVASSTRVELIPAEVAKWEAEEKDEMLERWESFKSGEDEISVKVTAEHAL